VTRYHLDSTAEANSHARDIDGWWREQRAGAPEMFVDELARMLALLARMPMIGAPYRRGAAPKGMRRHAMRRVKCHLYYTVDTEKREILVHAIWHWSRGRGPF
jgi:plasmid stabilization system protein ParE